MRKQKIIADNNNSYIYTLRQLEGTGLHRGNTRYIITGASNLLSIQTETIILAEDSFSRYDPKYQRMIDQIEMLRNHGCEFIYPATYLDRFRRGVPLDISGKAKYT